MSEENPKPSPPPPKPRQDRPRFHPAVIVVERLIQTVMILVGFGIGIHVWQLSQSGPKADVVIGGLIGAAVGFGVALLTRETGTRDR